jgi:hypothetical protein
MPSPTEIEKIRTDLATDYAIDLAGIYSDVNNLGKIIVDKTKPISSMEIYGGSATYTSNASSAFVPDLETLKYSDISPDQRLYSRRVEQNLEEALRYSQSCLQIRQEYGEIAKLRNDTRFKGEEFIRLDLVHNQEVAAGLYQLPWQEARDEQIALESTIPEVSAQQTIIQEMMQSGAGGNKYSSVLSDASVQAYIDSAAQLAKNSASFNKSEIHDGTAATTNYRTKIEFATWLQTLASLKGNLPQLNGRLSTAKRKEDYLRQDVGFRSHRAAISRHLAYLQVREHCRDNSPLNYNERLTSEKVLFESNLRCLIERVKSLQPGLKDNYSIDLPLADPETGKILDEVSPWLIRVQNELTKYKRGQRLFVQSIWSDKITITSRGGGRPLESFDFSLPVDTTGMLAEKPLLRGVAFEYSGSYNRPLMLQVLPPAAAYIPTDRAGRPDTLQFGRVFPITPALDIKPQHPDVFWNGAPSGDWKIQGMFDQSVGNIDSFVMHIWLAAL